MLQFKRASSNLLLKSHSRAFSYNHNFHTPIHYYFNKKLFTNDFDIQQYSHDVKLYLTKRWISKREVPPKIRTIDVAKHPNWFNAVINSQKLAPQQVLYDSNYLTKISKLQSFQLNSQFVISIVSQEYQKQMYDAYVAKNVMNGFVAPLRDAEFVNEVREKSDELINIFYKGEKLTLQQKQIQHKYLVEKNRKLQKYAKRKVVRFQAKLLPSDISLFQGQDDYRMFEADYFYKARPTYFEQKWQRAQNANGHQYGLAKIQNSNWNPFKGILFQRKMEEFETRRRADLLLQRIFHYHQCYEFVHSLNMPQDFMRLQGSANIHIWLVQQRLKHFSVKLTIFNFSLQQNIAAQRLAQQLIHQFKQFTYAQFNKVDVNRRRKKATRILQSCQHAREQYNFHFYGNAQSADNPYYKMDALVWKNLFGSKIQDRYCDEVYKFGHYFVKMFQYINSLSFEDIAHRLFVDWNAGILQPNYRDYMTRLIRPLEYEQFESERNNEYSIKSYEYEYRHPRELTLQSLKRTFANMVLKDKLFGLRLDTNMKVDDTTSKFDVLNSQQRNLMMMDIMKKLSFVERQKGHENQLSISQRTLKYQKDNTNVDFMTWMQNYFTLLKPQVKELIDRKINISEYEREIEQEGKFSAFDHERSDKVKRGQEYLASVNAQGSNLEDLYKQQMQLAKQRGEDVVDQIDLDQFNKSQQSYNERNQILKNRNRAPSLDELKKISKENQIEEKKKSKFF